MPLAHRISTRIATLRNTFPLSPLTLVLLTTAFVFCFHNATYRAIAGEVFEGHPLPLAAYNLALFLLVFAIFALFAFPYVVKPVLAFIPILSASTSYYIDSLGVIVDRDMIQNVMVTTLTWSRHLVTFSIVKHVFLFGIVPAVLVVRAKLKPQGALRALLTPSSPRRSVLLSQWACSWLT